MLFFKFRSKFYLLFSEIKRFKDQFVLNYRGLLGDIYFPDKAENLLVDFYNADLKSGAYNDLFRYFITGYIARRSQFGALAAYSGMRSYNGPLMDRLEGFSRVAPLIAAWLFSGRPRKIDLLNGETVDLVGLLKQGILAGTCPESKEYWGNVKHWQQTIVEAADIALVLWLSRSCVWNVLSYQEREQISSWLIQVNNKHIPDNNWHLFVVQVNVVLSALGMPFDESELSKHYDRAKSFYRGNGWFRDGVREDEPGFDYYNAWGFHYSLQWINRIFPGLDKEFIDSTFREFVETYKYFIGPLGFPMLGRSSCYRMAAPVPLILACDEHTDLVSPGEARRALDVVWQYFIRHGAVRRGNVTQGYFGSDARLLEDYSGPASCLWSLRSLVAAYAFPDKHSFWNSEPELLPVEKSDYRLSIGATRWEVIGEKATGMITIKTIYSNEPDLDNFTVFNRIKGMFSPRCPHRPKNVAAKYFRSNYSSKGSWLKRKG